MPPLAALGLHSAKNVDISRHPSLVRRLLAVGLTLMIAASCTDDASPTSSSSATSTSSPTTSSSSSTSLADSQLGGTWVGTWAIDPPYADVVGTFTMELVQVGDSFSGTIEQTGTDCSNGTVSGTVTGTSVTFGWVLTSEPVQFSGVLNGTSMSGTWSSVACSDPNIPLTGTWEATRP